MSLGEHRRWFSQRSLSSRGRLLNAFSGLGSFLALTLLGIGLYLIDQQFADPLRASDAALLLAALLLASSLAIFGALLHAPPTPVPRRSSHSHGAPPEPVMALRGPRRVHQTGHPIGQEFLPHYRERRYVDL